MKYLILFSITLFSVNLFSQTVGIGTATPDSSAILDLSSSNKGFLMPRMTTAQRDAISNPSLGLKIFNTDDLCEDTYDGNQWMKHCSQLMVGDSIRPADNWTELNAIPNGVERYGMFTFSFGNKIITGLGRKEISPNFPTDVMEYDVITKNWTQKNNFPGAGRNGVFSCVVNGKGYLFGGFNNPGEVWEYNPINDIWTQKNNFPGGNIEYFAGFSIGDKTYLGTGNGSAVGYENDFWEYTPSTDSWVQKENVPGPGRNFATGFAIGNKGYIGLGRSDPSIFLNDIYEYNPVDNTWEIKQVYPGGGVGPVSSFVINGHAYVGLGTFDGDVLPIMYIFDPTSSPTTQWTALNDFPGAPRTSSFTTVINKKAYFGCGFKNAQDYLNDLWVYHPFVDTLQNYKEQTPSNINNMTNHDWSSENETKLFATNTKYKVGIGTKTPKVKLHVEGNNDAGLGDNSGLLLVGELDGQNILIDNNEIMARDNGVANQLILQNHGGKTQIGGETQIGGKVGLGVTPSALLHLKGLDGTSNRHIKLESNSSSEYTTIYAGTNFIIENSSPFGDFYFKGGTSNSNLFSINPEGSIKVEGALNITQNSFSVTTTSSTLTINPGNLSYIKLTCTSGSCSTCNGSACPDLILSNGNQDGHMLILRSDADANRGLYMPGNLASTTNYRLTANFQLANNNIITLMWISSESEWREISRATY